MTDFIFEKDQDGNLRFKGDFEGLYRSENDPWDQSGHSADQQMDAFYRRSRAIVCDRAVNTIAKIAKQRTAIKICEIGAGFGYLTQMLQNSVPEAHVCGSDISQTAVSKAALNFPKLDFFQHDILNSSIDRRFDILILSNILWYVIHDIDSLIANVLGSLEVRTTSSFVVVQNALFKDNQRYGSDVVSSIGTLTDTFVVSLSRQVNVVSVNAELHCSPEMVHDFGLLVVEINAR